MTDRERRLMDGLRAFGWCVYDPWEGEFKNNSMVTVSGGAGCPVCGGAAPSYPGETGWPTGESYENPDNHLPDCAFAELLREG